MKRISEKSALRQLAVITDEYRAVISERYEHKAASCISCPTPGACCLDEHFVNVRISRLEAAAIRGALEELPAAHRDAVDDRITASVLKYGLGEGSEAQAPLARAVVGGLTGSTLITLVLIPVVFALFHRRAAQIPAR